MEGAANVGPQNDAALFLGIFGSGKTTLATDPTRQLIGDSEIGWGNKGVFSLGRGCYAKALGLSSDENPDIYQTTRRFGTLLENVSINVSNRHLDLDDEMFTENTRASYPIKSISNAVQNGVGSHPRHIILLAMDAFGVLPPVSKLTPEQARYHFLSGYTSQLVANRDGTLKPKVCFSSCYGAPFMPLHPGKYARLFDQKIRQHDVNLWLVNTGWIGGAYETGQRIPLAESRAIVRAILEDKLNTVETQIEPYFGLAVPVSCPGVSLPSLNPADAWHDKVAYKAMAAHLAKEFDENYAQYHEDVDPARLALQPDMG